MDAEQRRREELAAFLKDRRTRADRAAHGLPDAVRSRVPGLRREEVAMLAGVSVTWYTWLEQARPINPSRQVLESIARLFRLSAVEASYLLDLGGHGAGGTAGHPASPVVAPQRLLDALAFPAFLLSADWSIIAWNAQYAELYPRISSVPEEERNLLWLVFTDESLRRMLPDWDEQSRGFVGAFRAETRGWLRPVDEDGIVARVSAASPEFAMIWQERDVAGFRSRERLFRHPSRGLTRYEQHSLVPADAPELTMLVYVPLGD